MMFNLLKFQDRRGNLSVMEGDAIPFDVKRCIIYMMYQAEVKEEDIAIWNNKRFNRTKR
jgi:hypothetical protein